MGFKYLSKAGKQGPKGKSCQIKRRVYTKAREAKKLREWVGGNGMAHSKADLLLPNMKTGCPLLLTVQ